ncbi:hypothetical protein [Luteibacter sp. dw_328]|uniref:hypothetical protein n=1 Tax=Luteibacter sp. dw_328 TaxID=2719796 RepID=UPI001BD49D8F|nr:hypothetical protein [Luteibacter sp. dw_328]
MSDTYVEEVNARVAATEARVATAVEGVRIDHAELRASLKSGLLEIRIDMEKMRGDIRQMFSAQTKCIVVIVYGALAAAGTAWGFLKPPTPMSLQPAPYLIYAQPTPAQAQPVRPPGVPRAIDP